MMVQKITKLSTERSTIAGTTAERKQMRKGRLQPHAVLTNRYYNVKTLIAWRLTSEVPGFLLFSARAALLKLL